MTTYEYHIDSFDTITAVNDEWLSFARENNAWELSEEKVVGKNLWSFIGNRETTALYQMMIKGVRTGSKKIRVRFRCDSPSVRRKMQLHILPGPQGAITFQSELLEEEKRKYVSLLDNRACRASSFVIMCSWCNSVQTGEEKWDEVEVAVEKFGIFFSPVLPKISHAICPACLAQVKSEVMALQNIITPVPGFTEKVNSLVR